MIHIYVFNVIYIYIHVHIYIYMNIHIMSSYTYNVLILKLAHCIRHTPIYVSSYYFFFPFQVCTRSQASITTTCKTCQTSLFIRA